MAFTITATNSEGARSLADLTASQAFSTYLELRDRGFEIVAQDQHGRTVTLDELAMLSD